MNFAAYVNFPIMKQGSTVVIAYYGLGIDGKRLYQTNFIPRPYSFYVVVFGYNEN